MPIIRIEDKNLYNLGSTITPGHWGQHVRSYGSKISNDFENYAESLRQKYAPNAISRLACIFAFDNTSAAEGFLLNNPDKMVYELQPLNTNQISRHNYSVITYFTKLFPQNNLGLIQAEENLLIDYWTGDKKTAYITQNGSLLNYDDEILIGCNCNVIAIR